MSRKKTKNKEPREKMNAREKSTLIVTIILAVALIIKSVAFDEERGLKGQALEFKNFVDYSVEEEYDGFLYDSNILMHRVFNIFIADPELKTVIKYVDPDTGEKVETILDVRYTAQVRKYLFGIFPIKQFSVTAKAAEIE